MDPQASPPKRMTRARAAKVEAVKTTKIVTAAAKAKATRSITTAPASTKRKTRADEVEDENADDEEDELAQPEPAVKTRSRGRPKKVVAEPEPQAEPAPVRSTRGRPKKTVSEPAKEETQPARPATRTTRAKKLARIEDEPAPEEKKAATRTRGTATGATRSTAAKSAVKKTVKFEEPEKENIAPPAPATRGKGKAAAAPAAEPTSGLRAKPLRRPAASTSARVAGTRATAVKTSSGSGSESMYEKPAPLSPKKVTQMAMHNRATPSNNAGYAESEDELAADEKTPANSAGMNYYSKVRGPVVRLPKPSEARIPRPESTADEDVHASVVTLGSPVRPPPSPWKDSMKTPAKKLEIPGLGQSVSRQNVEAGQPQMSAFRTSLLQSPAKRPQSPIKGLGASANRPELQFGGPSPFKTSLMSPPKRPMSPNKTSFAALTPAPKPTLLATPLPAAAESRHPAAGGMGGDILEEEGENPEDVLPESPSRLRFPGRLSAIVPRHADPALDEDTAPESAEEHDMAQDLEAMIHETGTVVDDAQAQAEQEINDPMLVDESEAPTVEQPARGDRETTTPPASPPQKSSNSAFFGLRDQEAKLYDEDSEDESDELANTPLHRDAYFGQAPTTPCPTFSQARTPKTGMGSTARSVFGGRSTAKRARTDDKFGFTPLIGKLNAWGPHSSPLKSGMRPESPGLDVLSGNDSQENVPTPMSKIPVATSSPARTGFFDEAMVSPSELNSEQAADDDFELVEDPAQAVPDVAIDDEVLTPELDDIPLEQADIELAAEANVMSLLEPEQVEEIVTGYDEALSEASQEYGDENEIPIDPTLLVPPVTPQRNLTGMRGFHTVSKVPLKPADESTPRPRIRKRGHSISRLPVQRPTLGVQRNATVISYSPSKQSAALDAHDRAGSAVISYSPCKQSAALDEQDRAGSAPPPPAPVTPSKSENGGAWSTAGTPARTPRRDLHPGLLKGAVVYVDVHTSEGADASGVFVELLGQMGARCVKSWPWNPSSPPPGDGATGHSRIGITHVVFKDGGKRTLEKVRESAGVVQCVGVSWVLDCERRNEWLDEAPYYIDTSLVPRGGARRRKSMEPKALANLNGMLVATAPSKQQPSSSSTARDYCQSAPATPANGSSRRRDSSLWIRTPEDQIDPAIAAHDDDDDWEGGASFLTPVPKTPAPDAIARYAAALAEATPTMTATGLSEDGEEEKREAMMTRTCPPKRTSVYHELGEGILTREKDEGVLMRLIAARRKSLQFAPKVGSPLARAWE